MPLEKSQHLGLRPQAAFVVRQCLTAQLVDPHAQADCGQHIGQTTTATVMQERQRRRDRRHPKPARQMRQVPESLGVLAVIARGKRQADLAGKAADQAFGIGLPAADIAHRLGRGMGKGQALVRRQDQHLQPLPPVQEVGKLQPAIALFRPQAAKAEQPAQPPPGRPVTRQAGHLKAVLQDDAGGGDQPDARPAIPRQFPRFRVRPHDPRDRVHIGHGQGLHPHLGSTGDHLLGMRGPDKEGEIRKGGKLDKGHAGDSWEWNKDRTQCHGRASQTSTIAGWGAC